MTEVPPGDYPPPPPPPSAGGYAPPPPGPVIRDLPTDSYTPWLTRFLAYLIDVIPTFVFYVPIAVIGVFTAPTCSTDASGVPQCDAGSPLIALSVDGLVWILVLAFVVWNFGYRQGTTGSSIGKSVLKFKVVSEVTGQPIGFGLSIVRQLAHFVDGLICYIGYLLPLWDAKRQTLADKIMTTVCLPI